MCFVWISEQTAIISLYNINWVVCITETECVYCAVWTGSLYIIQIMCFVWISEQTAIISTYKINWLVFIMETDCVFCEVLPQLLYIIYINFKLQIINASRTSSVLQRGILQYKSLILNASVTFRYPTGCMLPNNQTQLPCIRKRRGRKQTKRAERRIEEEIGERECPLKIPFLIILIIQWNIKGKSWAAWWLLCLDWLIP
jgi:hypothetical protein